jgi:hypothetical protein
MTLLIVTFMVFVSFLVSRVAVAQTTDGKTEAISQNPQTMPQGTQTPSQRTGLLKSPQDYPVIDQSGRVYPLENLDPFSMSTLGSSTGAGYNKEGSTLSTRTKRKSNLEVNKPRQEGKSEEVTEETGEETSEGTATTEEIEVTSEESSEGSPTLPLGRIGKLYRWVDKNGVIHVTNDLGSVPPEYQGQMVEDESSKPKGK